MSQGVMRLGTLDASQGLAPGLVFIDLNVFTASGARARGVGAEFEFPCNIKTRSDQGIRLHRCGCKVEDRQIGSLDSKQWAEGYLFAVVRVTMRSTVDYS